MFSAAQRWWSIQVNDRHYYLRCHFCPEPTHLFMEWFWIPCVKRWLGALKPIQWCVRDFIRSGAWQRRDRRTTQSYLEAGVGRNWSWIASRCRSIRERQPSRRSSRAEWGEQSSFTPRDSAIDIFAASWITQLGTQEEAATLNPEKYR